MQIKARLSYHTCPPDWQKWGKHLKTQCWWVAVGSWNSPSLPWRLHGHHPSGRLSGSVSRLGCPVPQHVPTSTPLHQRTGTFRAALPKQPPQERTGAPNPQKDVPTDCGLNHGPSDAHTLIPRTRDCVPLQGKRDLVDVINLRMLKWKQRKHPQMDEGMSNMWSVHTVEYYSALKRREILTHTATWGNLEDITPVTDAVWFHLGKVPRGVRVIDTDNRWRGRC